MMAEEEEEEERWCISGRFHGLFWRDWVLSWLYIYIAHSCCRSECVSRSGQEVSLETSNVFLTHAPCHLEADTTIAIAS